MIAARHLGAWALVLVAAAGCGKKGPPLPPLVRVPDAAGPLAGHRVGDDVVLSVTWPVTNIDESTPVDLARVEVYGYTGRVAPPVSRFGEVAPIVARIERGADTAPVATLRETLTPDTLAEGKPLPSPAAGKPGAAPESRASARGPLKRFYLAVAFSDRGRPGPPSPVFEIPLTPLPDPPDDLRATYAEDAVMLEWGPSGGLVGFLLDRAPLPSSSPLDDGPPESATGAVPAGPTRYNVYRARSAEDPGEDGKNDVATANAAAVNPAPLDGLDFSQPLASDGRRRCFVVAAVRGGRDRSVEGHPSAPACVTAIDVFPPAPPTGVSPIAVEGAINLVWEANSERDLGGYLVWRGVDGDAMLTRISDEVVTETRFTDGSVQPGVRYVYAVTAVDEQNPTPNVSAESERVEVTAR